MQRDAGLFGQEPDAVAVVGMTCRFPGSANATREFWRNLRAGAVAVTQTPAERFDVGAFYSADPDVRGKTYSKCAGYADDPYRFDSEFFGISDAEALEMDPQQRWLLELCWSALENAGIVPSSLRERRVGLFLSVGDVDYARRTVQSGRLESLSAYAKLGANRAVAVGRVAYHFGFQGPAIHVDTTCSSSLVAIHLAAQSLLSKECDLALAGGVNLILGPEETIGFARLRAMSVSDTCRTFDARADGYIRGEGGGVVVLKRAADAAKDKNRVDAVIIGSAVNNDGPSNGMTAPNGAAQELVIADALKRAGIAPQDVSYVEAHGTGTPLGDPIELSALRNVYAAPGDRSAPLIVGALKPNIGHLEAAAGVAGFIKAVLVAKHRLVPAQANFDTPNPRFRWQDSGIAVAQSETALPRRGRIVVGVSSFGLSGTNAHLLLASDPASDAACFPPRYRVLPASAQTQAGLTQLAQAYADFLNSDGTPDARDLCFTACVCREHFAHRAAFVGRTADEFVAAIQAFRERSAAGQWHASSGAAASRKVVFMFAGQGAWRSGFGREFFKSNPFYRAEVEACLSMLDPDVRHKVERVLFGPTGEPVNHRSGQLAHFIAHYALARAWIRIGVKPDCVVGHSLGEHVAAAIAGVASLPDSLRIVEARGRLFDELTPDGAMLAAGASVGELRSFLEFDQSLFVAGINGPSQTVISGTPGAIAAAEKILAEREIRVSRVTAYNTPGHSPLLAPMLPPFREAFADVRLKRPSIEMVSTLTGRIVSEEVTSAGHWTSLVDHPVLFHDALAGLVSGSSVFLEIGPGSALSNLARSATGDPARVVSSFADAPDGQNASEEEGFAHACARLYCAGVPVAWDQLYGDPRPKPVEAPTYCFAPTRFELPMPDPHARSTPGGLPGRRLPPLPHDDAIRFEATLDPQRDGWLNDHVVRERIVCPGAAMLVSVADAALSAAGRTSVCLRDVTISTPCVVESALLCHVSVAANDGASGNFSFHSRPAGRDMWTEHLAGRYEFAGDLAFDPIEGAGLAACDAAALYRELETRGLRLRGAFRRVQQIATGEGRVRASLRLEQGAGGSACGLSFSDLDAMFQICGLSLLNAFMGVPVPVAVEAVEFHAGAGSADEIVVDATARGDDPQTGLATFDFRAARRDGSPLVTMRGLQFRDSARSGGFAAPRVPIFAQHWREMRDVATRRDPPMVADRLILEFGDRALERTPQGWRFGILAADQRDVEAVLKRFERPFDLCVVFDGRAMQGAPADMALRASTAMLEVYRALTATAVAARSVLVVTRRAIQIDGEQVEGLAASAVWGLVRTLAQEDRAYSWRMVDLDHATPVDIFLTWRDEHAREIAIRADKRYERIIQPAAELEHRDWEASPFAWHVVTGAFGAIGLNVADVLYKRGARRLALVSRNPKGLTEALQRRFAGADLFVGELDVADPKSVETLFDKLERDGGLGVVAHCAGHVEDGAAATMTNERLAAIMRPKVLGGWAIHRATEHRAIQNLILFSSAAAAIGNPGQSGYAAANLFLAQLAHHRRSRNLPAISIDWGLWEAAGASEASLEVARERGFAPLRTAEATLVLDRIVGNDRSGLIAARVDWNRYVASLGSPRPPDAIREMVSGTGAEEPSVAPASDVLGQVIAAARHVARSAKDLDPETSLTTLGFDSLAIMELRSRLQQRFGRAVPTAMFIRGLSLRALANFYEGADEAASGGTPPAGEPVEIFL